MKCQSRLFWGKKFSEQHLAEILFTPMHFTGFGNRLPFRQSDENEV